MTLKILKPTTPGQRGTVLVSKSHLWKGEPHKSLLKPKKSSGGTVLLALAATRGPANIHLVYLPSKNKKSPVAA